MPINIQAKVDKLHQGHTNKQAISYRNYWANKYQSDEDSQLLLPSFLQSVLISDVINKAGMCGGSVEYVASNLILLFINKDRSNKAAAGGQLKFKATTNKQKLGGTPV